MILQEIESMGLSVSLKDDNSNLFVTPKSRVTPHARKFIKDRKASIIHEMLLAGLGEKPGRLTIGPFEPTPIRAFRDRVIVTFVIGKATEALAKYTLPRIRQYACDCGADMVVVRDDQLPDWPIGNKLRFGEIARQYDRALLLDCDIWINDHAPDIFDQHRAGCWMHPDVATVNPAGYKFLTGELAAIAQQQGREVIHRQDEAGEYRPPLFNTGVILLDQVAASSWQLPPEPLTTSHTAEQAWIDLMLSNSVFVNRLADTWNWCPFQPAFADRVHAMHFVHLANMSHADRLRWLRRRLH